MSSDVSKRVLVGSTVVSGALLVIAVIGLGLDHHTIAGAPAWLKPAKFAVSVAVYCATVLWLLRLVPGNAWLRQCIALVTGASLVGELALIDLQVLRGTTSHFNTATPFDRRVFGSMGVLVALVFLAAVVLAVLLARAPGISPGMRTGVAAGLGVCLLGMAEAGLMIAHGGHAVGAPDARAGSSMWLTDWNLAHGDLRIAHFVGLHGLQVIPLCAWALERTIGRSHTRRTAQVVGVVAVFYAGLIVLLSWEAELGRPLQRPGPLVGSVAVLWVLAAALTVGWRLRGETLRRGLPLTMLTADA